ncbi:ion channel [Geodermatophilus chilensis]|uniref:ion channel n=1 Tax=Geodermatophilus chilensis TaxID=2035835 RepID=UPI000C264F79|nr:ion channel [Geodermatophilus chilensis]
MLDAAAVAVGAALVLGVFLDVLATTLTMGEGAGWLTRRLLASLWGRALRLRPRGSRSRLLSDVGPALLVLTVLIWVLATWVGWWLVFLGSGSVESAETGAPASAADVAYYAGFAVSTLGVGDFVADSPVWRVMTSVAGFGGLALVTLAITYLLSVVSAVVSRRALATQITALGSTAAEVVVRGWTGASFAPAFTQHLVGLAGPLATVAQQHFAYPVLHYFRSAVPDESAPVAIAVLDDALFLLAAAVDPAVAPEQAAVEPARRAIARYIRTVGGTSAPPSEDAPPPTPSVEPLRRAGVPLRQDALGREWLDAEAGRRRRLQQLVHEAGWSWPPS